MDENYLDNLLNEISLDKELDYKIEDELDNQMQREKRLEQERNSISKEDLFDMDLENDASQIEDTFDLQFSEKQIEELDQLDDFADLDMGDIDFSDIDFNDVDVTKLDEVKADDLEDVLRELEGDLTIDDFFDEKTESNSEEEKTESSSEVESLEGFNENLNEETFDADDFLNSLLEEPGSSKMEEIPDNLDAGNESPLTTEENVSAENNDGLDDLFSMLNLDEMSSNGTDTVSEGIGLYDNADAITEGEDDLSVSGQSDKTKKGFMQILFGDPDEEDELSEEELKLIEEKKAAKKEKKEAAKQAKKEKAAKEKEKKNLEEKQKKQKNDEIKRLKAQKRALENSEPEKPLNKPMVAFVFTLFLGGIFLFYIFTNNVNYTQAIERASKFFANQKYKSAYDEIVGVEVKEKDQELKERIYTVMYVERLYEAYENNVTLNREEKALDSLLRGVDKYYEHYEEAAELGITSDLDYCFNQIQTALSERYGISVEAALELNKLENYQYVQSIDGYVAKIPQTDNNVQ